MVRTSRQVVRNAVGKILGYIDTMDDGNKEVRNSYCRLIGRYDKRSDTTRDSAGRILYKGDQTPMLIAQTK